MRTVRIVIILLLATATAFGSPAWAAPPVQQIAPVQIESPLGLTGSGAALESALNEPSGISYKILVIDEEPADRTAYLDELLATWGWPESSLMLLVIFPRANYDIRFALGADFRRRQVTVDEVLRLVRTEYLSRSQKGDAAGGLAALVRAVNRKMAPGDSGDWLSLSDPERLKIARELLNKHLSSFKGETVPEPQRLREFRIEGLKAYPAVAGGYPLVLATYSVHPVNLDSTTWVVGNGVVQGDWVTQKSQFLRIGGARGGYVIEAFSTSP